MIRRGVARLVRWTLRGRGLARAVERNRAAAAAMLDAVTRELSGP